MNLNRRDVLKCALRLPAAAWLNDFHAVAAPLAKMVKSRASRPWAWITSAMGCLIRIETDAGIVGYGEAGLPSAAARERIALMLPQLVGQDPLAIERHFYMMSAT
ncbi:MAG: mandelate racemase/muconate lactonizing enzyme family protein [Bryobacterales bacterium]|nr:mandelate racemase/muconate lactonizing enzyme family protein [Bryobacterales bacterium]